MSLIRSRSGVVVMLVACTIIIVDVLLMRPRVYSGPGLTDSELAQKSRLAGIRGAMQMAMLRKDYAAAESDIRQAMSLDPKAAFYYWDLGDYLLAKGKRNDARLAYRRTLDDPNIACDASFFMRYAELCRTTGAIKDARYAYARVVNCYSGTIPSNLAPYATDIGSLTTLRATALACAANYSRETSDKYLEQTTAAVEVDGSSYFARLMNGDALYANGRFADSLKEFHAAIRLAPAKFRSEISSLVDGSYPLSLAQRARNCPPRTSLAHKPTTRPERAATAHARARQEHSS